MLQFYPDKNSLKEVMSQKLSLTNLKELCRTNGVFLLSNNKECLINTAHLFFWGYNEINFLADAIDDERNNKKSIRLNIQPILGSQANIYDVLLSQIKNRLSSQKETERLKIKEVRNINEHVQEIEFQYIKHQKGRVRLLDEVEKNFTLLITANDDKSAVIDVTHDEASDVKTVKDEIQRLIGINNKNIMVKQVNLKSLVLENRVILFDRFFSYTFNNWRTDEIKSIKLVKDVEFMDSDDDEEGENLDNSILSGINSALLQGTALRTNAFVQNCLNRGYYFSQATVRLAHNIENIKISIDIIFRGANRQLEINIAASYEIEEGRDYKKTLPVNEQRDYLRYFHDIINEIYSQLLVEQSAKKKE
jgi:hypothetical protein